jgi:glutathione S-transferase
LCLVDAAYAPFLQRLAMVEKFVQSGILRDFPLVQAWSDALVANDSVKGSVADSFNDVFYNNLKKRGFYVGSLLSEDVVAAE